LKLRKQDPIVLAIAKEDKAAGEGAKAAGEEGR
jgi:hypothetical protein